MRPRSFWVLVLAVAAAQSAVLAWMVWQRVTLLRTGREVVVDVVPVDPRSLFRGDYVRFNYDFSRIGSEIAADTPLSAGKPVYVLIGKVEGDKWRPLKAAPRPIETTDPAQVVLKGLVQPGWNGQREIRAPFTVRYGIESYFVPEGEGRQLETMVREKRISVVVAVGADGTAAIKGILADGKPVHIEKAL